MIFVWNTSKDVTKLNSGELRIFRSRLESTPEEIEELAGVLSAEEVRRAERFVFRRDRDRFVKGRGVLRQILESLLDVPAGKIQLSAGPFDKPCLSAEIHEYRLKFNLTHSHGLALYAFSLQREVGIDLEKVIPGHPAVQDVRQYFSPAERVRIEHASGSAQTELFFRCWVMKEAYVKALGEGLQIPLSSFELPTNWAELEGESTNLVENWTILPFTPAPTYRAAVVVEASATEMTTLWDWHHKPRL
jgi:4'-phosphopantetheinyl transferase